MRVDAWIHWRYNGWKLSQGAPLSQIRAYERLDLISEYLVIREVVSTGETKKPSGDSAR